MKRTDPFIKYLLKTKYFKDVYNNIYIKVLKTFSFKEAPDGTLRILVRISDPSLFDESVCTSLYADCPMRNKCQQHKGLACCSVERFKEDAGTFIPVSKLKGSLFL